MISGVNAVADERQLRISAGAITDAWRRRARDLLAAVSRGEMPYRVMDDLHRDALDELAGQFSLDGLDPPDRERLVQSWHRLPAWPDAAGGLNRLRERHVVSTLSNGGMAHQVDVIRHARLPFDCILSTELVQSYKPDPRTYQLVPSLLRVRPEQAMMVASHPYDLAAAAGQGFRTGFVRRPMEWGNGKPEEPDFRVDIVADDFGDLASKLGA